MRSNAEKEFASRYPNVRIEVVYDRFGRFYRVYAADYLCAESYSRQNAFANALSWAKDGLITPDPEEVCA
jgi:hypothetical protein